MICTPKLPPLMGKATKRDYISPFAKFKEIEKVQKKYVKKLWRPGKQPMSIIDKDLMLNPHRIDFSKSEHVSTVARKWWNNEKNPLDLYRTVEAHSNMTPKQKQRFYYILKENKTMPINADRKDFTRIFDLIFDELLYLFGTGEAKFLKEQSRIRSEVKIWVLNKINETSRISPTKLFSDAFREREYRTPNIAKISIEKSLKAMMGKEIELIKGNGFSSYKLLNAELENDQWFKIENI